MNEILHDSDQGFTIIEVIVTLVVVSLFLTVFFQLYLAMESQRISVARRATANNIAYTNLRKFNDYTTIAASVTCDSTTNLVTNTSAAGKDISNMMTAESTSGLDGTVTQKVLAFYPRGCATNMPLLIQSSVTYGSPTQQKVMHASYIN